MSSPVESSKKAREASAPSNTADGEVLAKVEHPHEHFEHPADVVMDPLLSKPEKAQVLDALEQDARQLSMAADEGMPSGGGSGLQNVLVAKESLELPPFALAMSVCLQSLKGKLEKTKQPDTHAIIARAIEAVEAAHSAIEQDAPAH